MHEYQAQSNYVSIRGVYPYTVYAFTTGTSQLFLDPILREGTGWVSLGFYNRATVSQFKEQAERTQLPNVKEIGIRKKKHTN